MTRRHTPGGRLPVDRTPDATPKPRVGRERNANRVMAGIAQVGEDVREQAYWEVLGFAKEQPDSQKWGAEILDVLGLRKTPARAPGCCRDCGAELPVSSQTRNARSERNNGQCLACSREVRGDG